MKETGVIKYNCNWIKTEAIDSPVIDELNTWRDILYKLNYIGVYPDGIGYGNISHRINTFEFIISGSATGMIPKLTAEHYTKVIASDSATNSLTCEGPIQASSESLTHAAIYNCNKHIHAIIHIHDKTMWRKMMNKVPTTLQNVKYGTTAMADEIVRLFKETTVNVQKILVMAGHEEGIIAFGETLDEAGEILINENNM